MAKTALMREVDPKLPTLVNAAHVIGTRLDEMFAYDRYTDTPDRVLELHAMRIAAKRLRYTLEIFQPAYARVLSDSMPYEAALESVKALQETLGFIHDADVLVPQLTAHLARLLKPGYGGDKSKPVVGVHHVDWNGCVGLATLCEQLREERDRHFATFGQLWRAQNEAQTYETLRHLVLDIAADAEEAALQGSVLPSVSPQPAGTMVKNANLRGKTNKAASPDASPQRDDGETTQSLAAPGGKQQAPASGNQARPQKGSSGDPDTHAAPARKPKSADGNPGERARAAAEPVGHPGTGAHPRTRAAKGRA